MNRIYQGKVTKVEIIKGKDAKGKPVWEELKDWQSALWNHHELFQDAVNYYTLALAAMAAGVDRDSIQAKALREWVAKVRETWVNANKKSEVFAGPQERLAPILKLTPAEASFEKAVKRVLSSSRANASQRASALFQLLSDKGDLNQVCGERLPWFATAAGKLTATSKATASDQEVKRQAVIRQIHRQSDKEAINRAGSLNLGLFLTQPSKKLIEGDSAAKMLRAYFIKASTKFPALKTVSMKFNKFITSKGANLKVPSTGRKPSGLYPIAAVFKFFPTKETLAAFCNATKTLAEGRDREVVSDAVAESRVKDQPHFDYFTNRALIPEDSGKRDTRAVWFEFDLAAFIEAIKAPRRYLEDTLTRDKKAAELRTKKVAMEGRGGKITEEDENEEGSSSFGFEGDERIKLIRKLVTKTLGYLAEAEESAVSAEKIEYTIQERTLRGFSEIRKKWCSLSEKNQASQEKLLAVLAEQQTKHRDDFGSATLYRELAKPEFHPIWCDSGTQPWHAEDPLKAWRIYTELRFELKDRERPIRFTPAHAEHSPRYFIIPKQGKFGSEHLPGTEAFTCGMLLKTNRGLEPTTVRLSYSAPRLCRDELRQEGDTNIDSVPWLQPMMKALDFSNMDTTDFSNCRVTLQPYNVNDIQLTFPLEVIPDKLIAQLGKAAQWKRQFNLHPDGDNFYSATLRWPHEKQLSNPPQPWWESLSRLSVSAVDLGQRDAGGFARLEVRANYDFGEKPSRFIGETPDKKWRAVLERSGLFRLPGEDAQVWREKNKLDERNPEDSGKLFDFREELWGEHGHPARLWEADETAELMRLLEAPPEDKELTLLSDDWRDSLSFPEQNDKLLVAMRRYQSRIARFHRWCWFLQGEDKQQKTAWDEIADCEDTRLISAEQCARAKNHDPRLREELETQLRKRLKLVVDLLVRIANRILPLRERSWRLETHPASTDKNILHHLTQSGPSLDSKEKPVWLRGQRGLSLKRIEQIEDLRKRFQSLNQMLRREIGGKPPLRRDESAPDPCPDLLKKLDHLKEQRINQTAHLILAEALGLCLAPPPSDKPALRHEKDQHGIYEKILDKSGKWIGPVDFIVIEDLSRYRASQGRAPRENSRLMKWCHRAVRDKLKQLCEVFGLPVLETPAAWSSRFCSRSGAAGFRAVEVGPGFENKAPWRWLKDKTEGEKLSDEAKEIRNLILTVNIHNENRDGKTKKFRTFVAPQAGGPIFVPVTDKIPTAEIQPAVVQADINAAINLGLRAVADPRLWEIHPRLRTQRNKGGEGLLAREKRKFGEKAKKKITLKDSSQKPEDDKHQPNFFADLAHCTKWGFAELEGERVHLVSGKALWSTVKELQWSRCQKINAARINGWKDNIRKNRLAVSKTREPL